jgi:hypothetical protein
MKNLSHPICLLLFLLMIIATTVTAQREMIVNEELSKNSTPMLAKPKGIGTVSKYQFGPYKIASGKEGWSTTSSKSKWYGFETQLKSKRKLSFVFIRNITDSAVVNVSVNSDAKQIDPSFDDSFSILRESKDNYLAIITLPGDSIPWKVIIASRAGANVKGEEFFGMLTDGQTELQMQEVLDWKDGKKSMVKGAVGYEFRLNDKTLAAAQVSPDTFQKKIVWIHQDLSPKQQLVLAATAAVLFIRSEDALK